MNKELLNVCYKYFNRYINSEELISLLKELPEEEVKELLNSIVEITNNIPNEEDELVKKRKESLKKTIDTLGQLPKDNKELEPLVKQIDGLEEKYKKEEDSYNRWYEIVSKINENEYFNQCFEGLDDYQLLEFICQYIKAPFPPKLKQEEFDKLVNVGKEKDEREYLWRLAFNYEESDLNFDEIVDYYIAVKDSYYLSELISSIGESLDLDRLIDKINDKDFAHDLIEGRDYIRSQFSDEQFNRLKKKGE